MKPSITFLHPTCSQFVPLSPCCLSLSGKWSDLDICTEYTLAEIEAATDKWSSENLLGEGAFGQVFKGTSPKGLLWAVKRSFVMTNDFEVEVRSHEELWLGIACSVSFHVFPSY